MKTYAGHAKAYLNMFSAGYFFLFLNPKGAVNFCICALKSFVIRATKHIQDFRTHLSKIFLAQNGCFL